MEHVWRSNNTLQELVLPSRYLDPGDGTQVVRPGGKRLYPLSHPASVTTKVLDNRSDI